MDIKLCEVSFSRRLRRAYPKEKFVNTALFQAIKAWEASYTQTSLAVARNVCL